MEKKDRRADLITNDCVVGKILESLVKLVACIVRMNNERFEKKR